MRYAIVSDIHANWQAWQAVKDDIRARQVDVLFCLGDVVGYGPRPVEVLADVRRHCNEILMGNHEAAASGLMDDGVFTDEARGSLLWTRKMLGGEHVRWCRHLPYEILTEDVFCAHAETPAPPEFGYVEETEDAAACFDCNAADFIFLGHTHLPALFLRTADGEIIRAEGSSSFQIDRGARVIVNVGSVGMPRDGTAQASYCLFEPERRFITFCRVSFDCEALRRDIQERGSWLPYFLRKGGTAGEQHAMRAVKVASHRIRMRVQASTINAVSVPVAQEATAGKGVKANLQPQSSQKAVIASVVGAVILLAVGMMLSRGVSSDRRPLQSSSPAAARAAQEPLRRALQADYKPGLAATYFQDSNWTQPAAVKVDSQIVFDWGRFAPMKGVNPDSFSVAWTGYILSGEAGNYTFTILADDYAEVIIDGQTVVKGSRESGDVELQAKTLHAIEVKYRQDSGPARIRFSWAGPGLPQQVVPAARLWHK